MINENKIRQIYKSNREQGFQLLVECFQEPIYYYIRRLVVLHEDAEDVLQEVFIQVYRHWEQFRCESSLSTWIYRIATNESLLDEMQRNVRKHTYGSKPAGHRLWITVSAGIAIAAALVGFLFMPSLFREGDRGGQMLDTGNCTAVVPADKWIREMSDEELEELVSFSESDIFLN